VAVITEGEQRLRSEKVVEVLLRHLGEDLSRPGLADTPKRFVKAMEELTRGLREPPPEVVFSRLSTTPRWGPWLLRT